MTSTADTAQADPQTAPAPVVHVQSSNSTWIALWVIGWGITVGIGLAITEGSDSFVKLEKPQIFAAIIGSFIVWPALLGYMVGKIAIAIIRGLN